MENVDDPLRSRRLQPAPRPWIADITLRMRRHVVLKVGGTTVVTALFFIAYLHLLRHPSHAVTTMPLTALDRLIPFQPQALYIYLSLWLYVGVGPGLQLTLRELVVYAIWICSLCATGLVLFYLWPTQIPPTGLDVSAYPGFAMLRGVDAAGNACPSMHVAVAMFTALCVDKLLSRCGVPLALRLANWAWFVAIAYSTLATGQHVVLDVVAGAALGTVFAYASQGGTRILRGAQTSLRASR